MATKQKEQETVEELLRKAGYEGRKNGLKKLFERSERGHFVTVEAARSAVHRGRGISADGLWVPKMQLAKVMSRVSCPCGHCEYYAVEFYADGRYVVHHEASGMRKKGRWNYKKG